MNRWMKATAATVIVLACLCGCTQKLEKRIIMLEDANRMLGEANRDLADRLNKAYATIERARKDRGAFDNALLAARQDAEDLRGELANMPLPEEAAPGWTPVPGGAMIAIADDILFPSGSAKLKKEAQKTLDAVASAIAGQYAEKDVLVFGHTDNQPISKSGWKDNYELSAQRALAVTRYLQSHGVSASKLIAAGCGEHRPRASNASTSGMAANRRVEIYAIDMAALRN
jgi:flagellar motor protein MotB